MAFLSFFRRTPRPGDSEPTLQPAPSSVLKFKPEDVFELAIAGTQVAQHLITSDGLGCAVCMREGEIMALPSSHHPLCKVARWWRAVDALKVGIEVTKGGL